MVSSQTMWFQICGFSPGSFLVQHEYRYSPMLFPRPRTFVFLILYSSIDTTFSHINLLAIWSADIYLSSVKRPILLQTFKQSSVASWTRELSPCDFVWWLLRHYLVPSTNWTIACCLAEVLSSWIDALWILFADFVRIRHTVAVD